MVRYQFQVHVKGPLQLYPSASVLNYGQGLFEGVKGT